MPIHKSSCPLSVPGASTAGGDSCTCLPGDSKRMRIHWQEHSLDSVMQAFVDGFKPKGGESVHQGEWFIDVRKGKVVFKLYIEGGDGDAQG